MISSSQLEIYFWSQHFAATTIPDMSFSTARCICWISPTLSSRAPSCLCHSRRSKIQQILPRVGARRGEDREKNLTGWETVGESHYPKWLAELLSFGKIKKHGVIYPDSLADELDEHPYPVELDEHFILFGVTQILPNPGSM